MITSVAVALANVIVLLAGLRAGELVAATTVVRVLAYFVYRRNAYRVFPPLRIRPSLFRRSRLREVTGFSVYASIIDWANKLNYQWTRSSSACSSAAPRSRCGRRPSGSSPACSG